MNKDKSYHRLVVLIFSLMFSLMIQADDWSMWRNNPARTAESSENLSKDLVLLWSRQYSKREMVWDDPLNHDLMPYDMFFEPVIFGKSMILSFNAEDKIAAFDTETGKEKWSYYTDGPVRFPAAIEKNRVFFTSDDGYLYCVNLSDGKLNWKFFGAPEQRKILGNKRLISSWPARGGVVVKDGKVYFAAGIWPFMGTYLYAIDASNGTVIWQNSGNSYDYIKQPHNTPAFAGLAPQGALALSGNYLLVPGGRSVPGGFDLKTGKQLYFNHASNKANGGSFVCATNNVFFGHSRKGSVLMYNLKNGSRVKVKTGKYPVITKNLIYFSGKKIIARHLDKMDKAIWELSVDATGDLIKSGDTLYAGGKSSISAIKLSENGTKAKLLWTKKVNGEVKRLCVADGKLFVVTLAGKIMVFGPEEKRGVVTHQAPMLKKQLSEKVKKQALQVLQSTGEKEGYAFFYGLKDSELLKAVVLNSKLNFIAIDPDPKLVNKLRRQFDEAGIKASRAAFLCGTPTSLKLPPYLANLTIVNTTIYNRSKAQILEIFNSTRPYGGKIIFISTKTPFFSALQKIFGKTNVKKMNSGIILSRRGALKGSANWNHQYGDIQNSVKSNDKLVKLPLGLLWFGGNSNMDVLPRHGHGPSPQIVDGKLFIEGMDCVSARDVYTGRRIWKTVLGELGCYGIYYDHSYKDAPTSTSYNQKHMPGANARGTNYIATHDYVYVIQNDKALLLSTKTGKVEKKFTIPPSQGEVKSQWAYIGVSGNYLLGGSSFKRYENKLGFAPKVQKEVKRKRGTIIDKYKNGMLNYNQSASNLLVCMDRHSGKIIWKIKSKYGFIHNSIISDGGTVYCLDKLPAALTKTLKRHGAKEPNDYRMLAINIKSGKIIWEKSSSVFGSWLGFSRKHNLLIQATRPSPDMISGESGRRMIAHNPKTGAIIWEKALKYNNPPILHGDKIITNNAAYEIKTGNMMKIKDPITEIERDWKYDRAYGCNYNIASEHLLTFRSAAAGFYDLANMGGTGNFGGFKSSCSNNLIAANGILNAPDYTRTCSCSYQNQTSIGFVYMPELEYWTNNNWKWDGAPVMKIGINLGAPGDRMNNKTLWLDYPSVGGKSPNLPINVSGEFEIIRFNSSVIKNGDLPWVAASGLAGVEELSVELSQTPMKNAKYKVRLYFASLTKDTCKSLTLTLQDKEVIKKFNLNNACKGNFRMFSKTFSNIKVDKLLTIGLKATQGKAVLCGVEIIK